MHPMQHKKSPQEAPRHNMLVVGGKSIFLSHLPMFMVPHNLQFILEVTFKNGSKAVDDLYFQERNTHPNTRIYTLQPEVLDLEKLLSPALETSQPHSFRGIVFRGHLERGGEKITSLTNIRVEVTNVVYSQKFGPGLDKSEHLQYILFGKGQELFLAHVITAPPDFDQILSVKVDHPPTQDEMMRGFRVTLLDRADSASKRIREGESVKAQGHAPGAHQFLDLQIQAVREFYFEEGDLASQM